MTASALLYYPALLLAAEAAVTSKVVNDDGKVVATSKVINDGSGGDSCGCAMVDHWEGGKGVGFGDASQLTHASEGEASAGRWVVSNGAGACTT